MKKKLCSALLIRSKMITIATVPMNWKLIALLRYSICQPESHSKRFQDNFIICAKFDRE